MKTVLHTADTRGYANHGWLKANHSFSFAGFYDPERVHFGALRVLNDDWVAGGMGFGKHPHDNMEIVTIPLSGELEHQDSMGNREVIRQHEIQLMSAGTGIQHSEKNPNHHEAVSLLQIWVFPKLQNITPRYEQKKFMPEDRHNRLHTVVAPIGDLNFPDALKINQEAWFSLGVLDKKLTVNYLMQSKANSGVYAFVIKGSVSINGNNIGERDALGISEVENLTIEAQTDSEILLIEVPMVF